MFSISKNVIRLATIRIVRRRRHRHVSSGLRAVTSETAASGLEIVRSGTRTIVGFRTRKRSIAHEDTQTCNGSADRRVARRRLYDFSSSVVVRALALQRQSRPVAAFAPILHSNDVAVLSRAYRARSTLLGLERALAGQQDPRAGHRSVNCAEQPTTSAS